MLNSKGQKLRLSTPPASKISIKTETTPGYCYVSSIKRVYFVDRNDFYFVWSGQMLNHKRSREIKSCCATRWSNNKGLWNRNHLSCFIDIFVVRTTILFFFTCYCVSLLLLFQNNAEVSYLVQKCDCLELQGKKSYSRIQHIFSDLPTRLKTPKQRACVAEDEDEDETANQQNDTVSGYNGCMCFSGMSWGPSALNVKHEWNSRC